MRRIFRVSIRGDSLEVGIKGRSNNDDNYFLISFVYVI